MTTRSDLADVSGALVLRFPAKSLAVHVLLPVGLGALTYLLFRDAQLLVFRWVSLIGLDSHLFSLRDALAPVRLPDATLFSMPGAFWVYATTSLMIFIWGPSRQLLHVPWIYVGWASATCAELFQAVGVIPGTYDVLDLAYCTFGFAASLFVLGVKPGGA